MRILITSGGTEEKIDNIRSITNYSSGKTGCTIADYFYTKGSNIYFVYKRGSKIPKNKIRNSFSFRYFDELKGILNNLLSGKEIDVVIHLAAVSDYKVEKILVGDKVLQTDKKINSGQNINLVLTPNPKLVNQIKKYNNKIFLVAFKLTDTKTGFDKKIKNMFKSGGIDILVHNNLADISQKRYSATIYNKNFDIIKIVKSRLDLAKSLYSLLEP